MNFFEFLISMAGISLGAFFIWMVFGVSSRRIHMGAKLSDDESAHLSELNKLAESMAERIKNLETILDAEQPEWREYDEKK